MTKTASQETLDALNEIRERVNDNLAEAIEVVSGQRKPKDCGGGGELQALLSFFAVLAEAAAIESGLLGGVDTEDEANGNAASENLPA